MSNLPEAIDTEINDLVSISIEVMRKAKSAHSSIEGQELAQISMWVTRIGNVITRLYGTNSQHYKNYQSNLDNKYFYYIHSNNWSHVSVIAGIIQAVQHEFRNDLINNIHRILQADIFSDFLEMSEYLLNEGYKDAAAVIIGSVLEDSVRKLANSNGIDTIKPNGKPLTLEPLNIELGKAGIYDKLIQKQITSWGELRNKAAHGHYSDYQKEQVQMMLLFVQQFCGNYFIKSP
ncbi:MAG: hypothetical protein HGN29_18550 [Asgard group archaeon]|nr:hypothetical protein [Asgard group archaeon]